MKRLVLLLLLALFTLLFGCQKNESAEPQQQDDLSKVQEKIPTEKDLAFLASEYTVTSEKEYNGISYKTVFYIVNDKVSGVHSIIDYPNLKDATAYYEEIADDLEFINIYENSVDFYSDDEDYIYCYGESFEKLKYSLKLSGYEVKVDFNEKEYFRKFPKDDD